VSDPLPTRTQLSSIDAFQATLPWPLDPFQVEAIEKLEAHPVSYTHLTLPTKA